MVKNGNVQWTHTHTLPINDFDEMWAFLCENEADDKETNENEWKDWRIYEEYEDKVDTHTHSKEWKNREKVLFPFSMCSCNVT